MQGQRQLHTYQRMAGSGASGGALGMAFTCQIQCLEREVGDGVKPFSCRRAGEARVRMRKVAEPSLPLMRQSDLVLDTSDAQQ